MKREYPDLHIKKRSIQNELFPLINKSIVYGLAGPDVNEYESLFPKTVNKIISYERNKFIHYWQKGHVKENSRLIFKLSDINEAPLNKEGFYDLDFMDTVKISGDIIHKFRNQEFMITLVNGRCKNQLDNVFECLEDKIKKKLNVLTHSQTGNMSKALLETEKGHFIAFDTYKDSCPMLTLFKMPKESI